MNQSLQNAFVQFHADPAHGTWSLSSHKPKGPSLENVEMSIRYRRSSGGLVKLGVDMPLHVGPTLSENTVHGMVRQLSLSSDLDLNAVRYTVTFALPEAYPIFLWKIALENASSQPIFTDRLELFNAGFIYLPPSVSPVSGVKRGRARASVVKPAVKNGELAFFSNGWQSWGFTGVYGFTERSRRTRLGPFTVPMRVNKGTPHPKTRGLFGSDMFGILGDRTHRTGILAGFLSQQQHFGSVEALASPFTTAMRMWANGDGARVDPGQVMETDWACINFIHLDEADPLGAYVDAVARENGLEKERFSKNDIPTGWCSWYQYFQKVNAEDVRANLAEAARRRDELPLRLIQIDDGFESQVGDWYSFSSGFPQGVEPLSVEIREAGFMPGLWLAPFIVHPKSRLAREHPEWLLRNRWGRPANAGFIWDTFDYALDLTAPGALDYAKKVVHRASHEWGYDFLKLDFLYAAALPGKYHDPTRTRAQVMRAGLQALREAAGKETHLLGCGCPLGSAIGLVDSMRIGADVDRRWTPSYKGVEFYFRHEPDMPSARNAIQNTITRSPFHLRWWVNDPDCLLLRPDTSLTEAEVHTLATVIALSGSSLLLSDNLPELPGSRLRIAQAMLPLMGKRPYVLDWFDSLTPRKLQLDLVGPAGVWYLVALFNWQNKPQDLVFNLNEYYFELDREYYAHSFWDGAIYKIPNGSTKPGRSTQGSRGDLVFEGVAPHGVVFLALRAAKPGMPQYLGGDLHVSQGLEVADWNWDGKNLLEFCLDRPGKVLGTVSLALPAEPVQVLVDGKTVVPQAAGMYCWKVPVEFERAGKVVIRMSGSNRS